MTDSEKAYPLILTLTLDKTTQSYFNELRKQYFPPERNYLDAHLTLFHNLPAAEFKIIDDIREISGQTEKMVLQATGIVGIGSGVAFKIVCETLSTLHKQLQSYWQQWLILQDKHKLWPHITIQNKVMPDVAKALQEKLEQDFDPFSFTATGLSLWEYRGGPWKFVQNFEFKHQIS